MPQQWLTHSKTAFEGYYARFLLPSGASLALVICSVPKASNKPFMVSLTYVPLDAPATRHEIWVPNITSTNTGSESFHILIPGIGFMNSDHHGKIEYSIQDEDTGTMFQATATSRAPWTPEDFSSSPEGWIANLPLPMHCAKVPPVDTSGTADVHIEKNWAKSFPKAHIWIQARDPDHGSSFCAAGGKILGLNAFLLGYRSEDLNLNFKPPFALSVAGISPFLSVNVNWEQRTVTLSVSGILRKIVIKAKAPKGTFFTLSSPFPEGHRENYLAQSFQAKIDVQIYDRQRITSWRLVKQDHFEGAALEFGGGHYPFAGTNVRTH
ncbi:hypothetical protein EG328_006466 [Venturia inaequalis]|uniref:Uncharacterized protein n=1 Tax=Venturia inaequalis TaxID=5025 RepID=A0A8H3UGF1_VENIN|nr:hypothetical protein EG328_006466 [Venturia inaequalis]